MHIWLDSTNINLVKQGAELGILFGVTTNPTLIAKSGKPMRNILQDLLDHQDGHVAVQVVAEDTKGMVDQGKKLYDFSDRIIVKIPVTQQGLEAIQLLGNEEIPTMATVILQTHQALAASYVGANYLAPYINRMELNGQDPWEMLYITSVALENHEYDTEILAASIISLDQLNRCAALQIPHITLKDELFAQFIGTDEATKERIDQFTNDWKRSKLKFL